MMFEAQVIDRATFLRHLEAPDLQAEMDLETADKLVIDEMIERMLFADEEEGESAYMPPTAYQPFDWAAKRAQQKLNRALLDGADDYNLDMLRRYIKHCDQQATKLAAANAPPPAMGAPMPANDMGAPAPAPAMDPSLGAPAGAPPMAA
jgi:hypothetical protein